MVNAEKLTDDELDTVSGGRFGPTQHTTEVKASNFDMFIHSARKVIILIGADWCSPSKTTALAPEDFAAAKDDFTMVGTMEVDDPDNEQLMRRLNITNIPVILRCQLPRLNANAL